MDFIIDYSKNIAYNKTYNIIYIILDNFSKI